MTIELDDIDKEWLSRSHSPEEYQRTCKELMERCASYAAQLELLNSRSANKTAKTAMSRFTAYRRNISQRDTHNHLQKNADHEPQFEGVVFTDGSVAIRWMTACRSTSIWSSLEDCINIHGHPEYGTEIVFHDSAAPQCWVDALHRALQEKQRAKAQFYELLNEGKA